MVNELVLERNVWYKFKSAQTMKFKYRQASLILLDLLFLCWLLAELDQLHKFLLITNTITITL